MANSYNLDDTTHALSLLLERHSSTRAESGNLLRSNTVLSYLQSTVFRKGHFTVQNYYNIYKY